MLAWRYEHRIRRREDLLFSFGSERGPGFPKDAPGPLGCRPSQLLAPLGASPLDAPGSIILEDLESVSTTLFCCSCIDYSFRLLLLSCPCVDLDKHSVSAGLQEQSVQEGLTPIPSSPTAFRLLSHTLTPIFYTSVTAPCSAGVHKATVRGTHMHAKAEISKQLTRASTSVPVLCDSSTEPPAWCSSSKTTKLHPSSVF